MSFGDGWLGEIFVLGEEGRKKRKKKKEREREK